jgi:hypothetical protein
MFYICMYFIFTVCNCSQIKAIDQINDLWSVDAFWRVMQLQLIVWSVWPTFSAWLTQVKVCIKVQIWDTTCHTSMIFGQWMHLGEVIISCPSVYLSTSIKYNFCTISINLFMNLFKMSLIVEDDIIEKWYHCH